MNLSTWFRGLRGKLLFSAVIPLFGFVAISVISIKGLKALGGHLNQSYNEITPNLDYLGRMGVARAQIGFYLWAVVAINDDQKERDSFIVLAKEMVQNYKTAMNNYENAPHQEGEKEIYAPVKEVNPRFLALTEDLIRRLELNKPEETRYVYESIKSGEWRKTGSPIRKVLEKVISQYTELTKTNNEIQKSEQSGAIRWLTTTAVASSVGIFLFMIFLAYRISTAIGVISEKLKVSGGEVSSAVTQLSTAGQGLAQASTQSAASLEETVAALEQISSMIKMNSDNAKQAEALSQTSKERAETGEREIKNLIDSMTEISMASKKIEEIITVIDDISFQTNLLALNAAVEAARAGEQGKSFAVVADAVRALAQRSAESAKGISTLINDNVEKIERGMSVADKSGAVLTEIVGSVHKVSALNSEISIASGEQTTGIVQVGKAMNQLDQGSQENAAASEEIAGTAEQISNQARTMHSLVQELDVLIKGKAA